MAKNDRLEAARIADQLRRAFEGGAWHGDSLFKILKGVTAAQAARPIPRTHTIWELVLHIAAWDGAVRRRLDGTAVRLSAAKNFPAVTDASETAWRAARAEVRHVHEELVAAVAALPTRDFAIWFRGRKARTTRFITCCMGWYSMSFIMPGRLRC